VRAGNANTYTDSDCNTDVDTYRNTNNYTYCDTSAITNAYTHSTQSYAKAAADSASSAVR
jgi:hypothetical protein